MLNIIDVIVIFIIGFSALLGFKQGFIKSGVNFVGNILIIIIAYTFKNYVANFLVTQLPFFDFGSIFKGVSVLNILIYEAIAFLILFAILKLILKLILHLSGIVEGILSATVILEIPSKIFGLIFGFLEGYVYTFIILFVLSLFSFSIELTQNSKFTSPIINHTPILTSFAKDNMNSISEIYSLKDKYEEISDKNEYNYEAMEILLKHQVITVDTVEKLVEQKKLEIDNIDILINKYSKDNQNEWKSKYN